MKHVACCSFGKDSLATVILAKRHNEPLDAVVYARVMYDRNRSAVLPEHEDFIFNTAIPKLKSWGIETIVVDSPKTFLDCFYRVRSRGANVGRIVGFPIPNRCEVQRDCKLPSFKMVNDMFDPNDTIWYVGIAIDEQPRLARLEGTSKVSLLAKYGYTEEMAAELCKEEGLHSPIYSYTKRGGCFFCPNASESELYHLFLNHPDIWNDLMALERTGNRATDRSGRAKFNRAETLTEIDARFRELQTRSDSE